MTLLGHTGHHLKFKYTSLFLSTAVAAVKNTATQFQIVYVIDYRFNLCRFTSETEIEIR